MTVLAPADRFPVEFARDATLVNPAQVDALRARVASGVTDLLVVSHGWNNDKAEAEALYSKLFDSIAALVKNGTHSPGTRRLAALQVFWPSKRFADEELIPGGAASAQQLGPDRVLLEQLDALESLFDERSGAPPHEPSLTTLSLLRDLVPQLEFDVNAQDEFGRLVRTLLPEDVNAEEPVLLESFYESDGNELLEVLSRPFLPPENVGGAAVTTIGGLADPTGGAAGLGNVFAGVKNGARNLLNLFTYYEMKRRAGVIGSEGLRPLLASLQQAQPALRLHLVGHSFGGRLVAAAVGLGAGDLRVDSLTLLQAAFSHWGFASRYDGSRDGLFRAVLAEQRVRGPILVTYTPNDRAVGLAYPLASRFKRQVAAGIGDANDPYGGIGRNGALRLASGETDESNGILRDCAQEYVELSAGRVSNLEATQFIADHGAVHGREVAHAILSAVLR